MYYQTSDVMANYILMHIDLVYPRHFVSLEHCILLWGNHNARAYVETEMRIASEKRQIYRLSP